MPASSLDPDRTNSKPSGLSYIWEVPGKSIGVRIDLDVVEGIRVRIADAAKSQPESGVELRGLLFGKTRPGHRPTVFVDGFEPIDAVELQHFREKIAGFLAKPDQARRVVGFWRSHNRTDFALDQHDISLFGELFSDRAQIALLIKPVIGQVSMGGVFFWEEGTIRGEYPRFQFPFDRGKLLAGGFPLAGANAAEQTRPTPAPPPPPPRRPATAAVQPAIAAPPPPVSVRRSRSLWLWPAAATAVALAIAGLGYVAGSIPKNKISAESYPALALRVERKGRLLMLGWNHMAPVLRKADRAKIGVADGGQYKEIVLSPQQLRTGRLAYLPATNDVSFKLEVVSAAQRFSESLRFLGNREPAREVPAT